MKNKKIERGLEGIGILKNEIGIIESKVDNLIVATVKKDFPEIDANNLYCPFFWECSKSPFGWCTYDTDADPAMDNCIYCSEPYERK